MEIVTWSNTFQLCYVCKSSAHFLVSLLCQLCRKILFICVYLLILFIHSTLSFIDILSNVVIVSSGKLNFKIQKYLSSFGLKYPSVNERKIKLAVTVFLLCLQCSLGWVHTHTARHTITHRAVRPLCNTAFQLIAYLLSHNLMCN